MVIILTNTDSAFDELQFFAKVKERPALLLGKKSFLSFRDVLFGMEYAFSFYDKETPLKYFKSFVMWYHEEILEDKNGYACWWNHILYTSGNSDDCALDLFFRKFEQYLHDVHNVRLPEVASSCTF